MLFGVLKHQDLQIFGLELAKNNMNNFHLHQSDTQLKVG